MCMLVHCHMRLSLSCETVLMEPTQMMDGQSACHAGQDLIAQQRRFPGLHLVMLAISKLEAQ